VSDPDDRQALPTVPEETYANREEFGRGGLGRVIKATDRSMGRTVAIKELLPGKEFAEPRFIREALVTARLEHPSIVPVYEAGRWPSGEPFYTMKLVSGRPLSVVVRATQTIEERLALIPNVIAVAEAIAYAHSRRVIHRDVKPSNVIIGQFGETVVIDWGLAKELGAADDEPSDPRREDGDEITRHGDVLGTPAYMAPEQARGGAVDERTDVYALGTLLYFVLAGVPPHRPTGDQAEPEPPEPPEKPVGDSSTVALSDPSVVTRGDAITVAATSTPIPLEVRRPDVPGELHAIVRKAMARDPAARYPAAKEFADDLKAFQTGRLVSAHRYTPLGLAGRWVRRNRMAVTVGAIAVLVLIAGGAVSLGRIIEARNAALAAQVAEQAAREQAERRSNELLLLQAAAERERDPTAALAWLKTYPPGAPGWDRARVIVAEAVARGVAHDVWRLGEGQVTPVHVSPDGKQIAAVTADGSVRLLGEDRQSWKVLGSVGSTGGALAWRPDSRALVAGGDARTVLLFSLDGGAPRTLGAHDDAVNGVAFSPDGKLVASAGTDRLIRLWHADGGAAGLLRGHELLVSSVAFGPDGATLASGSEDAKIRLWDVAAEREIKVLRADRSVLYVAFAPDGERIAGATRSGVHVWDLSTGTMRSLGNRQWGEAYGVAWDKSGRLITAGEDGLAVWDRNLGGAHWLLGHDGAVTSVSVMPNGGAIVSGGADGTVRFWPLRADAGANLRDDNQPPGTSARPRITRDGQLVAAAGLDGTILVSDAAGGKRSFQGHTGQVREIAFSPDGTKLASYGLDRTVRLWDVASGAGQILVELPTQGFRLRFAPDGRHLAVTQGFEELDIIDTGSGKIGCIFRGHNDSASDFSPDGKSIAFADVYDLMIGDVASCTSNRRYGHKGTIFNVAFAPDGSRVATASADHTVGLAASAGGDATFLRGHEKEVYGVAFAPDGRTLGSVGFDGVGRLWDGADGKPLRVLRGHDKVLLFLAFTPDGKTLLTAGADDTVRVWDVATGDLMQRETDTGLGGIAVAPNGTWIVSAGPHGLRRWPIDRRDAVPASPVDLARFIAEATTARIDEDGRLVTAP